ncbi:MAG: hypothetical protein QOF98_3102 [Streptomyces sp.]|nr:hypothetical protein [Streptomyces sp.]
MPVMGIPKFERFFRAAAGLDVNKNDLKRYNDFVDAKLYDLVLIGTADAKANDRDIIEPQDLPVIRKELDEGSSPRWRDRRDRGRADSATKLRAWRR